MSNNNVTEVQKEQNHAQNFNNDLENSNALALKNQNGESTELVIEKKELDIDLFELALQSANDLDELEAGPSLVPEYYEFKTSLQNILENASKLKEKERDKYVEDNLRFTKDRFVYVNTFETFKFVDVKDANGLKTGQKKKVQMECVHLAKADKMYIHSGVQLISKLKMLPPLTKVEIQFVSEEAVGEGNVKIYDVFALKPKSKR